MVYEMCREDRARQFMPFAALKGYPEALHKKEKIVVPKAVLSEEYKEELDQKMKQVSERDIISVIYFHEHEYLTITGMVANICETSRTIRIVNEVISFDDIYDIL